MDPLAASALLFLQSAWIGLSIAAPVGPIGLLTIQRTLDQGVRVGLATGLGAAVADACYGALAAGSAAPVPPGVMIAGVFAGSAAWWLCLCGLVGRWRQAFGPALRQRINRASALALGGFALWLFSGLWRG